MIKSTMIAGDAVQALYLTETELNSGEWGLPCEKCQGNGEIVVDWERYRHPREGDKGDEAVADCEKCLGSGRVAE